MSDLVIHALDRRTWDPNDLPTLAVGDVIRHLSTDEQTIYRYLRMSYPTAELLPIAPGTELYTQTGAGCSYIKSL